MESGNRVLFFTSGRGEHTVRDEINRVNKSDIAKVLRAVTHLQMYGQDLGRDRARHLRGKIWELREDRYRILYFTFVRNVFVILRVFVKKTQKTPERELAIAERRMVDYLTRFPRDLRRQLEDY